MGTRQQLGGALEDRRTLGERRCGPSGLGGERRGDRSVDVTDIAIDTCCERERVAMGAVITTRFPVSIRAPAITSGSVGFSEDWRAISARSWARSELPGA